jgi:hypothetical protein
MGPGRPFEKGNKLGKAGRPPGSRNKKTLFQEALEVDGEAIIEGIKKQALKSNATAMRLCMERLVPVAQASNVQFWMPRVETVESVKEATAATVEAVAEGLLSPQEGEAVARIVESQRRNIETVELEGRVKSLEEEIAKLGKSGK